jgi:hypothetical protein
VQLLQTSQAIVVAMNFAAVEAASAIVAVEDVSIFKTG